MKVFLRILAMILLVLPAQHLIRGLLPGILGNGYKLEIFNLNNTMVIVISMIMLASSIYLFHITEPFFNNKN
ncbi:hypothetical protein [Clostridium sp.]|uniref:hypothetical protein n=1 Tax=Clostridium sp. TaxID=1506 RepID=UPI003464572F